MTVNKLLVQCCSSFASRLVCCSCAKILLIAACSEATTTTMRKAIVKKASNETAACELTSKELRGGKNSYQAVMPEMTMEKTAGHRPQESGQQDGGG